MTDFATTRAVDLGEDALSFVSSSWVHSYKKMQRHGTDLDMFKRDFPQVVYRLFSRGDVWVSHSVDHAGLFWGWIACTGSTFHYAYVKKNFRQQGMAKEMLQRHCPDAEDYSLPIWHAWKHEKLADYGLHYNPYRIMLIGDDNGREEQRAAG